METAELISLVQESLFMILVFISLLIFAMVRGKQALINLMLGLYLAYLISLKFPYYDAMLSGERSDATIVIILFAAFTVFATMLFGRLMTPDLEEPAFEDFKKKILIAILGTIVVMAYSYHALPVTELITPGSPVHSLFAPESRFFWWLLAPLAVLFFL